MLTEPVLPYLSVLPRFFDFIVSFKFWPVEVMDPHGRVQTTFTATMLLLELLFLVEHVEQVGRDVSCLGERIFLAFQGYQLLDLILRFTNQVL